MSADLDNQHDTPGFEADGRPVPVVEPDIYLDEPEADSPTRNVFDSDQLLDALLDAAKDKDEIACRVLILGMLQKRPSAPASVAQFALWMNIPRTTARRKWTRVLKYLQWYYATLRPPATHR